jgi:glycosyltransferase involved in cell wall biosynthesis
MSDTLRHPRISVVTPSYNQGEFLEATLRSVIDQGYPELEYVVVDGGSTDGSVDIIKRHEADLASWVSEPDDGHSHAINKGFARTTGDIMCWINSSDMYYPWTLATVGQIFSDLPEVEWIQGVGSWFDTDGMVRAVPSASGTLNVYDVLAGGFLGIQQESVFWRRSLWERAGGRLEQGEKRVADFELWLRFFRLAPLYYVQTLLGGFRVHGHHLGSLGTGAYEREAREVHERFVAGCDRRSRMRGRLLGLAGRRGGRFVGDRLHRAGVLPWYRHPRVEFDFDQMRWTRR